MKVRWVSVVGGLALAVGSLAAAPGMAAASRPGRPAAPSAAAPRPWMNTRLSPEQRAGLLVGQMTLDEKIAMVHGAGYPLPLNAAGYAGVVPANARLGIPAVYLADSPVGVGNGTTGVTQWADTAALASTWDTSLASATAAPTGPSRPARATTSRSCRRSTSCGCRCGAARRRRSARTRT